MVEFTRKNVLMNGRNQNMRKIVPRKIDVRATVKDFSPNENKNVAHSFSSLNTGLNRIL